MHLIGWDDSSGEFETDGNVFDSRAKRALIAKVHNQKSPTRSIEFQSKVQLGNLYTVCRRNITWQEVQVADIRSSSTAFINTSRQEGYRGIFHR
jgi:hypothetical protein